MTTCLLIDDDPAFAAAARRLLEAQGLDVLGTAATATEGAAMVRSLRPGVVLVDVQLGEESGLDLAVRLASDEQTRGIPVVLMSGRSRRDYGALLDESPAVGFVPKDQLSAAAVLDLTRGRSRPRGG